MRVLVVSNDYPPIRGGISAVAEACVESLKGMGHRVMAIVPRQSLGRALERCDEAVGYRGYDSMATRLPSVASHLCAAVLRWRPDAVIAMNVSYAGPVLGLMPRGWAPRTVLAAFGLDFLKRPDSRLFQTMLRWVYRRADAVLTVSQYMTERLTGLGVDREKIRVLHVRVKGPNEAEEAEVASLRERGQPGAPLLLTVARLVRRKGIDQALLALPRVLEAFPGLTYWVAGEGPERRSLEAMTAELGLSDRVLFWGELDESELAAAYKLADLFVMTPRSDEDKGDVEGLGLSYLEASLAGLPCIGSLSGGVPEAVEDGVSGLLVREEDPEGLSQALMRLLSDPALSKRLGERGRDRARDLYSLERMQEDLAMLLGAGGGGDHA